MAQRILAGKAGFVAWRPTSLGEPWSRRSRTGPHHGFTGELHRLIFGQVFVSLLDIAQRGAQNLATVAMTRSPGR